MTSILDHQPPPKYGLVMSFRIKTEVNWVPGIIEHRFHHQISTQVVTALASHFAGPRLAQWCSPPLHAAWLPARPGAVEQKPSRNKPEEPSAETSSELPAARASPISGS